MFSTATDPTQTPQTARWAVPLGFLLLLCLPLAQVIAGHISLAGSYEESLGYRYFYSLRQIYADNGYVFLPQGQLMDLSDQFLQLVWSALGLSPFRLLPRIDYFSYSAVFVAHAAATASLYWTLRTIRPLASRLLLAIGMAAPYFVQALYGFYIILQPDYQSWIVTIPLLSLGVVLGAEGSRARSWAWTDTLAVAGLMTAALGLKATLGVYPLIVALTLIPLRRGILRSSAGALLALALGVVGWMLVLGLYYHGHAGFILQFFRDQQRFGAGIRPERPYGAWLRWVLADGAWPVRVSAVLPLALALNFLRSRARAHWALYGGLLLGAVGYHAVLYFRFQPVTWFEAAFFLDFTLIVAWLTEGPALAPQRFFTVSCALVAIGSIPIVTGLTYLQREFLPILRQETRIERAIGSALRGYDDRIAFLFPDNMYRPLTVDSGIWKGGSDMLHGSSFPAVALIRRMFPHRDYFMRGGPPVDLKRYAAVVFVVNTGGGADRNTQALEMFSRYHIDPRALEFRSAFSLSGQDVLVWQVADRDAIR